MEENSIETIRENEAAVPEQEPRNCVESTRVSCKKCGAKLNSGERFCGVCGTDQLAKGNKKIKLPLLIGIIAGVAALAAVLLIVLIKPKTAKRIRVSEITIKHQNLKMYVGDSESLEYDFKPEDANIDRVTWESSDNTVAEVDDNGKVTAVESGTCTISVITPDGVLGTTTVTVKRNLSMMFSQYSGKEWFESGNDGSWISIDTNPDDLDSDGYSYLLWMLAYFDDTEAAIKNINKELGFNDAVYKRMQETTAIQGRQSEENDKYKVSWTYHPDRGLEITWEVKGH